MIRTLASPDNQYIKLAASLRQKKYRDETGLFIVEGIRFAEEAIDSGWDIQFVMVSDAVVSEECVSRLTGDLLQNDCPVFTIPELLYKRISETDTPQGISLVVRQDTKVLSDLLPMNIQAPWLVLDRLQDPGNVGNMIRTADAAGAAGVILSGNCADVYAGKAARATMGSLFHLPVIKTTIKECLNFFAKWNLPAYVAGAEAATDYTSADLSGAFAIVLGNEGAGVGPEFRNHVNNALRIPLLGRAESLNVASAAAVILYEAVRQRNLRMDP